MPNNIIVVADDLTEAGRLAVEQALLLASTSSAEVHVVHVLTQREFDEAPGNTKLERHDHLLSAVPQQMWARVEQAGQHPGCRGAVSVTSHVRLGAPVEEIDRIAADYGAHLIVVGTHSRKGIDRIALGSVAEKLVRNAHCPVLVARVRDYGDVRRSDVPEEARPGEDLERQRPEPTHIYRSTQLITFGNVETHGVGPSRN